MKSKDVRGKINEGWSNVRPIDHDRYEARSGLEGPFQTRAGKVVYYDPKEGAYYDPDSDIYLTYDEWKALDETSGGAARPPLPPHLAKFIDPLTGDWTPDAKRRLGIAGQERVQTMPSRARDVTPKGYGPDTSIQETQPEVNASRRPVSLMAAIKQADTDYNKKVKEDNAFEFTSYLLVPSVDGRAEYSEWSVMTYDRTPGSNPLHLGKMLNAHAAKLGWSGQKTITQWTGDIDVAIAAAERKAAHHEHIKNERPMQYWGSIDTVKELNQAKEIMSTADEAKLPMGESEEKDLQPIIRKYLDKNNGQVVINKGRKSK